MPSFKYVIELSDQIRQSLLILLQKGKVLLAQSCVRIFFLLLTGEAKNI